MADRDYRKEILDILDTDTYLSTREIVNQMNAPYSMVMSHLRILRAYEYLEVTNDEHETYWRKTPRDRWHMLISHKWDNSLRLGV